MKKAPGRRNRGGGGSGKALKGLLPLLLPEKRERDLLVTAGTGSEPLRYLLLCGRQRCTFQKRKEGCEAGGPPSLNLTSALSCSRGAL